MYPVDWSMCTWKEYVFCYCCMKCSVACSENVCGVHRIWRVIKPSVSWLVFCLDDLSIFERGLLKSPAIIELLFLLQVCNTSFIYVRCFHVWCINIYKYCVLLLEWLLLMTFFVSYYNLTCFVWCKHTYPCFLLVFIWTKYLFLFSLSLCILKAEVLLLFVYSWVLWFLFYSATLCLLTGMFSSFTFKVIIGMNLVLPFCSFLVVL